MIDMFSIIISSGLLLYLVWESLRIEGKFGYSKQERLDHVSRATKVSKKTKTPTPQAPTPQRTSRSKPPSYL